MVGIFLRQLDQMDHEGGQEDLTGILVGRSQLGGELVTAAQTMSSPSEA